jgi:hypothetical protein
MIKAKDIRAKPNKWICSLNIFFNLKKSSSLQGRSAFQDRPQAGTQRHCGISGGVWTKTQKIHKQIVPTAATC